MATSDKGRRAGRQPATKPPRRSKFGGTARDGRAERDGDQGERLRLIAPLRDRRMSAEALHEILARDRGRYERIVYARLRGTVTWQDAEDIVSEALVTVTVTTELPE